MPEIVSVINDLFCFNELDITMTPYVEYLYITAEIPTFVLTAQLLNNNNIGKTAGYQKNRVHVPNIDRLESIRIDRTM